MFKSQNFCHIASNNRNNVKVGVFVYRTTDTLETVLTSGYFNDRIIDINLHDIIIHEKVDNTDNTKVEKNILCVTERTLENVGTAVIKSKWEKDTESTIANIQTIIDALPSTYVKQDGSSIMSAPLKFISGSLRGAVGPYLNGVGFWKLDAQGALTQIATLSDTRFIPNTDNTMTIGTNVKKINCVYTYKLNNGADLSVPNKSGTLATTDDVELAARSGRMLTDQGVWYAKMYSATVAPAAENGTNYADFSQVDSDDNPIIVIYTRTSGAWVQSETIVPPADYDGYVPVTSKIWDISEQAGQQGGRVLWNHTSKEFTPYPTIISFEDIEITGDSTVIMPLNPSGNQIVNKDYVDSHVPTGGYHPSLFAHEWDDKLRDDMQWLRADTFSWQDGTVYEQAYQHLVDDIADKTLTSETVAGTTVYFYLADDGHKICPAAQESNVSAIYSATGSAWYYIIDTDNDRFKLPRANFSVIKSLVNPSISLTSDGTLTVTCDGADRVMQNGYGAGQEASNRSIVRINPNPDGQTEPITYKSGISATLSGATALENAGFQYLYFYVGSFTQEAIENTAGLNAELFNDKADIDAQNFTTSAKEYLASLSMPSDQYDTLTLGASGTTYIAPATGYFMLYAEYNSGNDTNFDMYIQGTGLGYRHWFGTNSSQGAGRGFVPVKKGQTLVININGSLKNVDFKFVYSEGSKTN